MYKKEHTKESLLEKYYNHVYFTVLCICQKILAI